MTSLSFKKFFNRSPKLPFKYLVEILENRTESDKNTKITDLIDPWVIVDATLPKIDIKSEVFKASRPISYPFINFSNMDIQLTMEENDDSVVALFIEKCIMKRTYFVKENNNDSTYDQTYVLYGNSVRRMLDKNENKSRINY
jgi:hypothetical protein